MPPAVTRATTSATHLVGISSATSIALPPPLSSTYKLTEEEHHVEQQPELVRAACSSTTKATAGSSSVLAPSLFSRRPRAHRIFIWYKGESLSQEEVAVRAVPGDDHHLHRILLLLGRETTTGRAVFVEPGSSIRGNQVQWVVCVFGVEERRRKRSSDDFSDNRRCSSRFSGR